jgi:hypothetical protein
MQQDDRAMTLRPGEAKKANKRDDDADDPTMGFTGGSAPAFGGADFGKTTAGKDEGATAFGSFGTKKETDATPAFGGGFGGGAAAKDSEATAFGGGFGGGASAKDGEATAFGGGFGGGASAKDGEATAFGSFGTKKETGFGGGAAAKDGEAPAFGGGFTSGAKEPADSASAFAFTKDSEGDGVPAFGGFSASKAGSDAAKVIGTFSASKAGSDAAKVIGTLEP